MKIIARRRLFSWKRRRSTSRYFKTLYENSENRSILLHKFVLPCSTVYIGLPIFLLTNSSIPKSVHLSEGILVFHSNLDFSFHDWYVSNTSRGLNERVNFKARGNDFLVSDGYNGNAHTLIASHVQFRTLSYRMCQRVKGIMRSSVKGTLYRDVFPHMLIFVTEMHF